MKTFALAVFITHALFELGFGASVYISGASSSQSADQIAAQSEALTVAFRFMGSALLALGALGALVILGPGVHSATGRITAIGFALFHGLGTAGSLYTAAPTFTVYAAPLALGAVILHGLLAIGFTIVALRHPHTTAYSPTPG